MELFAGEDVVVQAEKGSREPTVVVVAFSQTGADVTGESDTPDEGDTTEQAFGRTPLRILGVDAVHVIARWRHGWQTPEMGPAIAATRAHIVARGAGEVVVIGASLGGFGALVFGEALGATRVLALAPQASVDLKKLRWDSRSRLPGFLRILRRIARFRGENGELPHDDMDGTLALPCPKFVLYDARTNDRLHADFIRGNNVIYLPVFHVGHQIGTYLRETRVFRRLLESVIAGSVEDVRECVAEARRNRRRSASYRGAVTRALRAQRRHPVLATRALEWMIKRFPRQVAPRHALVTLLLRQGQHAAALAAVSDILAIKPDDAQARKVLAGLRPRGAGRKRQGLAAGSGRAGQRLLRGDVLAGTGPERQ